MRRRGLLTSLLTGLAILAPGAATAAAVRSPLPLDAATLRAAKVAAARRYAAAQAGEPARRGTRAATVFGGLNQPGLGDPATNDSAPSDSTGAIGPNDYVEMVNSKIAVFRRTDLRPAGSALALASFIGQPGDDVFDPQVIWDPTAKRWFYLAADIGPESVPGVSGDGRNYLAYGWSKTADPADLAGGWCHFRIDVDARFGGAAGQYLPDYPKLGDNDTQLAFGTNLFDQSAIAGEGFVSANIWTVAKPANGDASCTPPSSVKVTGGPGAQLKTAGGDVLFTPVPANTFDSSRTGYVVAADSPQGGTSSAISAYAYNAAGDVAFSPIGFTVASYQVPANAPQPSSSYSLDTSDGRLTQAVARADPSAAGAQAIWTQHTVDGPGGRSVVRWYELLPASAQVRQQGAVSDPAAFAFNGAVSPSGDGARAALDYNLSGPGQLPAIFARARNAPQAAGFLGPPVSLGTSASSMSDRTSCDTTTKICRWGDYAGATPDPADSLLVWGSSQLVGPLKSGNPLTDPPQWITRNFALSTRDAPPAARLAFSPARPLTRVSVAFDGRGSADSDGTLTSYRWNFGGRQESSSPTPTHLYGRAGTFRVTLTVTDDAGETSTTSQTITVVDRRPAASLRVLTRRPHSRRAVRFDGRRSRDPDGRVVAYRWNFGGRQGSRRSAPTHVYGRAGRYRVTLTVIDDSGSRATTRRTVVVAP